MPTNASRDCLSLRVSLFMIEFLTLTLRPPIEQHAHPPAYLLKHNALLEPCTPGRLAARRTQMLR